MEMRKTAIAMLLTGFATTARAETPTPVAARGTQPAPAATPAPAPEASKNPLGITFPATMTAASDYSYRGISQTQRIPAFQPSIPIETGPVSDQFPVSAYVGMWASNVHFPRNNPCARLHDIADLRSQQLHPNLTL